VNSALRVATVLGSLIAVVSPHALASYDKMREFQQLCDPHGTALISTNVPCLKALLSASQDPIYNMSDPATALFLLDAAKLQRDVQQKRLTEVSGKERFLRLLIGIEDRHHSEVQAVQARDDAELNRQERDRAAADQAKKEVAIENQREAAIAGSDAHFEQQRREEQEQQRRDAAANLMAQQAAAQQQQRAAAVQFCIVQAQERSQYAFNAPALCETNPNYYQTVLRLPKVINTNCQGFGNQQVNCTSH
jgi:hypothetical protein